MKSSSLLSIIILFAATTLFGQDTFLTVAEKSDFSSTATHADVMAFIAQLKDLSPLIRTEKVAVSVEGREIPLLIIADPMPASPADLVNDNRIVVYVQANIHAGEVEGKEASLMFARDLLKEKKPALLRDVVLLICPIFNPDGNDQISAKNRTHQNGPANGVGVRHNGMMLDLNRDAMKAESPEVKGVIENVFNRWDPAVFMDCHTTNGSYHVEPVTFTWMVNPNGDLNLRSYMRDKMVPEMSERLRSKYKVENCFYGEFVSMTEPEKGWILDASEPRYMTNYYGIRNRLAILDENYVYADYKSRVLGNYYLIHSLMDFASANKNEIKKLLAAADRNAVSRGSSPAVSDSFAIEYKPFPAPDKVTIKTYEVDVVTDANGRRSYKKSDRQKDVTIPYLIDFNPVKSVRFPYAYLLTIRDPEVISKLKLHGIVIEKLAENTKIEITRYAVTELKGSARLNQGHYTNTIKGNYLIETAEFPAGTIVVRTAQKLANVAAYLLEPQSNDGLLTWNFLDRYLVPQWGMGYNQYPVCKVMEKTEMKTVTY